jgi:hypothetical protein
VLRYVHDVAASESLNIGVVLVAPELRFVGCKIDTQYARLSAAFLNFDGEQYRRVMQRLESAVGRVVDADRPTWSLWDGRIYAHTLMSSNWADNGLSYQYGSLLSGITRDPAVALEDAYELMVGSRYREPDESDASAVSC